MEAFRWISITLATFQGLCIARFLSGMVAVFRSRKHSTLDWIPLVWGIAIFVLQIQYWWAIMELSNIVKIWTIADFLLMLSIPLSLYLGVSLILPSDELKPGTSLSDHFSTDGHWGLACLAMYSFFAIIIDWRLFGVPFQSNYSWALPIECLLPLLFLLSRNLNLKKVITLVYLALILWSSWALSPKQYG